MSGDTGLSRALSELSLAALTTLRGISGIEPPLMPVRIAGFAKSLVCCFDFDLVSAERLEGVLETSAETLKLDYVEPSASTPLIESDSAFTHLVLLQHGTVAP